MSGVEILASEQIAVKFSFNWTMLFAFIILGIIFMSCFAKPYDDIIGNILIGILVGGLIGVFACLGFSKPTEYETKYKITISDEVKMNDFYEKYEIINQDGKIFTVREKQ